MEARTTSEWLALLGPAGVPCSPVRSVDEVFADPHTDARGMRIEVDALPMIGNPIHASATPPTYRRRPPEVGEHGAEILAELGMSAAEIVQWISIGVVQGTTKTNG